MIDKPQHDPKVQVYTASAGSGKTYTIAREYLRLALSEAGAYRHIQAVTFTNKATEEMKERILRELNKIVKGQEPSMAEEILQDLHPKTWKKLSTQEQESKRTELQKRAERCLRAMLLDYGSFLISTIDAFFQEVLRSFARDLNLQGGFRLEVESRRTLDAAVHALFVDQQYSQDSKVLAWIRNISLDLLRQNKSHKPTYIIRSLSNELLREEVKQINFSTTEEGRKGQFPSIDEVSRLKEYCGAIIKNFELEAGRLVAEMDTILKPAMDIGCKPSTALSVYQKVRVRDFKGVLKDPTPKSFIQAIEKPSKILTKSNYEQAYKEAWTIIPEEVVRQNLEAYRALVEQRITDLRSAIEINACIDSFALLSAMEAKIRELQKSENYILLNDAPSLIHKILTDEGGVPFLYERIGTRVRHHMIDEFQDTSQMQYENFRPLLEESLSEGQDSIVVGDIKQSIYRFRGSDSSLLGERVHSDLSTHTKSLGTNYRSAQSIVSFNNELYKLLPQLLTEHYQSLNTSMGLSIDADIFVRNYSGVHQEASKSEEGRVALHRYLYEKIDAEWDNEIDSKETECNPQDDEAKEKAMPLRHQLPELISSLKKRGYKPSDICILIRTKAEARFVAKILQEGERRLGEKFDFVSDDALAPTEAVSVAFVVSALHYIIKPEDKAREEEIRELYQQLYAVSQEGGELREEELEHLQSLGRKSLYETAESIVARYRKLFDIGELPYLIKLLDTALSFQQDLSRDIADFLDMWRERGEDLRLSLPEDEHKIRLMTIHKSKGLSAPVVLLPCIQDNLFPNPSGLRRTILWCDNPFASETHISKVPISLSNKLKDTCFAGDYYRESIKTSLDVLNLLYVATTRAEQEMHIWLPTEEIGKQTEDFPQLLPDLLIKHLDKIEEYCTLLPEDCIDNCTTQVERANNSGEDSDTTRQLVIKEIESYDLAGRIEELKEGLSHFAPERRRNFGNVMHQILSDIVTYSDVPRAKERAFASGELLPEEQAEASRRLDALLREPLAQRWFDGSATVLNETPILGSKAGTLRPDRILLYPDGSAVVVDYKFGKEQEGYKYQLLRYARLLEQMGYKPVRAYLWYLSGGDDDLSRDNAYIREVK